MSKTPPFLEHIPSLPEKLLQHEENIFCLGETVNTQQHMIDFLKEKYDSIKRRTFELMTANKEMRNIITAHVKIIAGLRANKNLTLVQEDLLLQFDQVHRAVCGKRRSHVDHVPTRRYSLIESLIVNPSVNRANMFESSSTQGSFVEVPASTTDVIVLKKRQSAIRKPNHPNMKALLTFPLFAQFPEDVMKEISASSYEIRKEEGQIVLKKGEEGREIFFLLEGTVSVLLDEEAEVTSTLQPITCFGELGVLFEFKRTSTVVAATDCTLLVVMKHKMDEAINNNADLRKLVDEFAANKEAWWSTQKYVDDQTKFGAEFVHDIARKDIKKLPIFASAPNTFIQTLATKMQCFVVEESQVVVSIGDESDAIYFILSGVLQVIGQDGIVHAEMTSGSFCGEVGVLLNLKRTASIRAKVQSHVFKLTKSDLDGVIEEYPVMKLALEEAANARYELFKLRSNETRVEATATTPNIPDQFDVEIGSQSLAKLNIFRNVDPSVVSQLSMKMVRKSWKVSENIIQCGDIGDGMYFLAAGNAEVITEFGEVIDTVSGPSAYFGEVALLEQVPRTASVKCITVCSTYALSKSDFLAVMDKYPEIALQIKETADARMQKYLMRNVLA